MRCARLKKENGMALLHNIWWYLVLIGVMILVHELGHYFAARFFDVKVETFSFGFGPRLFGFRRGETDFRFSLILFGGYVKMTGDQPGDEATSDPRSLFAKPRWQRAIIAFAGPAINVVLAVALLTGLFMVEFPKIPMPHDPVVGFVMPDGPADRAGIREGDRVVQVNNTRDPTWEDIGLTEIASARLRRQAGYRVRGMVSGIRRSGFRFLRGHRRGGARRPPERRCAGQREWRSDSQHVARAGADRTGQGRAREARILA
jgi:hypothetical protein